MAFDRDNPNRLDAFWDKVDDQIDIAETPFQGTFELLSGCPVEAVLQVCHFCRKPHELGDTVRVTRDGDTLTVGHARCFPEPNAPTTQEQVDGLG